MNTGKPVTTRDIRARKGGTPLVTLTAYTAPVAKILDRHCDLLLVGDSLRMVVYGMETTLGVTMDMMIAHTAAVMRKARRACVVMDLPFGSYQESPQQAFRSAARAMSETGCHAVKIEGGTEMAETVDFLVRRGIPVLGHVGLTPQAVNTRGGFRTQGRSGPEAGRILADAEAMSKAEAFAVVVEGVVEPLAAEITRRIEAPTIGIGASAACDGQVLVVDDMLGLFGDISPKFVKRYADLAGEVDRAVAQYAEEVHDRRSPGDAHVFKPTGGSR